MHIASDGRDGFGENTGQLVLCKSILRKTMDNHQPVDARNFGEGGSEIAANIVLRFHEYALLRNGIDSKILTHNFFMY